MSLKLYEFGPFRLDAAERTLWRDGQIVPLTPKALETLAVLVENGGRLVEKEDLLKAVWPDTFVEEGNLPVQISLLRKTLGDEGYIETVPRRGYRFVAAIAEIVATPEPVAPALPAHLKRRTLLAVAAATVTGVAFTAWRFRPGAAVRFPIGSMAVLPFQVLNPAPGDENLGIGLSDAVITRLGGLKQCVIRPTSAVRQFDQARRDPLAAGTALGVEAVLDASVQTTAGRIRLNAQLIRVKDGQHLWTDTFDLPRADLFTVEDELSGRLARSLFAQTLIERYRPKPEAHRLFTMGRYHHNRWNAEGQRKAIEYFEQAVAIDPEYAEAWAAMAGSWSLLGYLFGVPPREAYPKAEPLALKALILDQHLPAAHHVLGGIRFFFDWRFAEAELHVRRALEGDPNNPDTLQLFSLLRTVQGRKEEGVAAMERAVEIDPASQWRHVGLTFQYACAGRIDAALGESAKAHELDPANPSPIVDTFNLYMLSGRYQQAVDWSLKTAAPDEVAAMRESFQRGGIREFLRARIERALTRRAPMRLVQLYTFLGERDEAIRWIEQAIEQRQAIVIFINRHPMYAPLRDHPRFREIVRSIGL